MRHYKTGQQVWRNTWLLQQGGSYYNQSGNQLIISSKKVWKGTGVNFNFGTVMQKTALFDGKGNIIKAIYWI